MTGNILSIGNGEIILIVLALLLLCFFGGLIFIVYYLVKKSFVKQPVIIPQNVEINFGATNQHDDGSIHLRNKEDDKIALPQQYEIRYVFVNDIIRCEADDNYTVFYLIEDERILISRSLKEYSDLLKPYGFLRTHQSHLVNPNFVKSWLKEDGGVLMLKNGDKIPVSKPNRESVKAVLGK